MLRGRSCPPPVTLLSLPARNVVASVDGAGMTVYCEGDRVLLDERGERSDLEGELLRQGFRHPDFTVHVLRERRTPGAAGPSGYAVTVVNVRTDRRRIYCSGGRGRWVAEFARDLSDGLFGTPEPGTKPGPDPAKRAA